MPAAPPPRPGTQRGAALLLFFLIVFVLGAYAMLRQLGPRDLFQSQEGATQQALAQAKEALLGYGASIVPAASCLNLASCARPGDLPCPDLNDDGVAEPSCAAGALGRLPWKTLGLPDLRDSSGERLWYALSRNFRPLDRQVLNSDLGPGSQGTLALRDPGGSGWIHAPQSGSGESGAVALIIAPGAPLRRCDIGQQNRTAANANVAAHYLDRNRLPGDCNAGPGNDEDNAVFSDAEAGAAAPDGFIAGPVSVSSNDGQLTLVNDRIISISRDELLGVVEQRIAGDVRTCLESYFKERGEFPWPAPLALPAAYLGRVATLVGRLPDQEEGAGSPEAARSALFTLQATIATASTAAQRLAGATQVLVLLSQIRGIAYAIYENVLAAQKAAYDAKDKAAKAATASASTAASKADQAVTYANTMAQALRKSRVDLFLPRLESATTALETARQAMLAAPGSGTATTLAQRAEELRSLTAAPRTLNAAVATALGSTQAQALSSRLTAQAAAALPPTATYADADLAASQAVAGAQSLRATILLNGTNILPENISPYLDLLAQKIAALALPADPQATQDLRSATAGYIAFLDAITGGSSLMAARQTARDGALALQNAVDALAADNAAPLLLTAVQSQGSSTASLGAALAGAVDANGDNLSLSTLQAYTGDLQLARSSGILNNIKASAAILRDYEQATYDDLGTIVELAFSGSNPSQPPVYDAASAGIAAAQSVIDGGGGSTGDFTTLLTRIDTALASLDRLDASYQATTTPLPVSWPSQCAWLEGINVDTWWARNQWKALVFYQIYRKTNDGSAGTLTINGKGKNQVVVVAAGRRLASQGSRPSAAIGDYLEDINASPSRNAPGDNPDAAFIRKPSGNDFNDHLR
ncbi:hypothetical protein AZSI13_04640 [Azospira sp. I13]|uniref:hypothetical protein n=1 Tax=Azospira sp. I13 TaxID=1765050 RepID=UPI000D480D30|nr:hypothetical protein [Azospira sp. I13]GBG01137.1 hypothetical protein AZSI13_04640 [Azospira sp. I13]